MAAEHAPVRPTGRPSLAPTRNMGAWKLAYADFLTALCALFLVLWLVHGATAEQKESVVEQFGGAPIAAPVSSISLMSETGPQAVDTLAARLRRTDLFSDDALSVAMTKLDNGLRIDLMDPDRAPMFDKGLGTLNFHGEKLIRLTASALAITDYPISIEGHTDSDPVQRLNYSNWDLSSDRANAARRSLVANGLATSRIQSVAGLADTQPLDGQATNLPLNRRLSIVIHLE